MQEYNFGIAIHGGAGTILKSEMTDEKEEAYLTGLRAALDTGFAVLKKQGSSLDAVESAVSVLEDNPLFNAGRGSVFNANGEHEMDASIMEGRKLEAGAVAAVQHLKNPIQLSRKVLEDSDHILLIGEGALAFAKSYDLEMMPPEYFHDSYRYEQWQKIKDSGSFQLDHSKTKKKYLGTVGAVALDSAGNLAAATSTGGMTNKKFGRIGDSPIIGAGTYADNRTCAVSCTGSGEYLMKGVTAFDVHARMLYKNISLELAAKETIMDRLSAINGDGGLIAIDQNGNIAMPFNCEGMYRGFKNQKEKSIKIYK